MSDITKLHPFCQTVFSGFMVRKTAKQKQAFRNALIPALQSAGWPVHVHSGGAIKSHNVIVGNPTTAKWVLTAHYDTPARMPFPNFIMPQNLLPTLLYQIAIALPIAIIPFLAGSLIMQIIQLLFANSSIPVFWDLFISLALVFLLLYLLMAGPANPNNANDNTSGVLTLLEAAFSLPAGQREDFALVFFDNEELGLLGSAHFAKKFALAPGATLLNFDCVGNGDTLLFVQPKACRADAALQNKLAGAFKSEGPKQVSMKHRPFTLYPSDQKHFKRGIAVAALRRAPVVGLYVNRIHTAKDTLLQQENILFLSQGIANLAQQDG